MSRLILSAVSLCALLSACGGVQDSQKIKSSDEWLEEQDREGAEQLRAEKKQKEFQDDSGVSEDEKKREWDDKQADLELRRAARSAETCPESVPEKAPKGVATVTLVFQTDGHVKTSTISPPYADTPVGACVLRAMGNIIVPAYTGGDHTVEWEIDLTGAKKSGPGGAKKE
jgi:hypothetical protein